MSKTSAATTEEQDAYANHLATLWELYRQHPRETEYRNALVERYLWLVKLHAKKLCQSLPPSVGPEDMVTPGVYGLIDAMRNYDPDRGFKFESYAVLRIRGAMLDEIRQLDWVPRLVRVQSSKIDSQAEAFRKSHGRPPSIDELADQMSLQVHELEELLSLCRPPVRKEASYTDESGRLTTEIDYASDQGVLPPDRSQSLDVLQLATKGLNKKERLIVILYYYEGLTMKEIGKAIDLSESRVSQMHSTIIHRLRTVLAGREGEFVIDVRD